MRVYFQGAAGCAAASNTGLGRGAGLLREVHCPSAGCGHVPSPADGLTPGFAVCAKSFSPENCLGPAAKVVWTPRQYRVLASLAERTDKFPYGLAAGRLNKNGVLYGPPVRSKFRRSGRKPLLIGRGQAFRPDFTLAVRGACPPASYGDSNSSRAVCAQISRISARPSGVLNMSRNSCTRGSSEGSSEESAMPSTCSSSIWPHSPASPHVLQRLLGVPTALGGARGAPLQGHGSRRQAWPYGGTCGGVSCEVLP